MTLPVSLDRPDESLDAWTWTPCGKLLSACHHLRQPCRPGPHRLRAPRAHRAASTPHRPAKQHSTPRPKPIPTPKIEAVESVRVLRVSRRSSAPLRAAPLRPLAFVPQARVRAVPPSAPRTLPRFRGALCGPVTRLALPGRRSSPPRFTFGRGKARASPGLCGHLPPRPPAGGCMAGDPGSDRPPCPPSRGGRRLRPRRATLSRRVSTAPRSLPGPTWRPAAS